MRGRIALSILVFALAARAPVLAGSRRVDVGGFKLSVRCVGEGSPVVVLDAGAGDSSDTWEWVVPDIRRFTRVCVYDRAGLGRSDPGPEPRTSDRIVGELARLLERAHIPGPYVLAGHSFGGLNMRLFASLHPGEVAGLVLVDATPEEFPGRAESLLTRDESEKLRTARALGSPAFRSELDAMAESAAIVKTALTTAAPVIVLTAAHVDASSAFREAWIELQAKMAARFPHARQILVDRSGHYIQYDRPEVVVGAIRELTEAAREAPSRDRPGTTD